MGLIDIQLLLLILVANGAPILGAATFGSHAAWPVDGGCLWFDGHPLLGVSKTWRGVLLAVSATTVMAWLLHLPLRVGLQVGAFAVLGDFLSSFSKRRMGLASSSMALGLDQIPEALLPLLAVKQDFRLDWSDILETVAAFIILELLLSQILYRLNIRNRPY
ncbi:MAG: CDP-archaeol synthase [Candidatus Competibacteraceae bacterium]